MQAPGAQALVDGVDVDTVVRAVLGCPGVVELHGVAPVEVATYLPGRKVVGLRVGSSTVDVQVRAAWGVPAPQIAAEIRAAVLPLAGGRSVDVTIAAVADPPGNDRTGAAGRPGDSEATRASDLMDTDGRALARPAAEPAGTPNGDPLLADAQRQHGGDRTETRIQPAARTGTADRPTPAMPSGQPDAQSPAEPSAPLGWPSSQNHPARTREDK